VAKVGRDISECGMSKQRLDDFGVPSMLCFNLNLARATYFMTLAMMV
jgi:hypothetical protein